MDPLAGGFNVDTDYVEVMLSMTMV